MVRSRVALALMLLTLVGCGGDDASGDAAPALPPGMRAAPTTNADGPPPAVPFSRETPVVTLTAQASFPHDSTAYTQGLLLHGGRLFESTGLEGPSDVRVVQLATGTVERRQATPARAFGEGIALLGNRLYQLTWQNHVGHVYDARTLAVVDSFHYEGEGWGLTTDGISLYLSDGSPSIRVIDPEGFRGLRAITVTEAGTPVKSVNELEWVNGELWANIYLTDYIARIDPQSGHVIGWLSTAALLTPEERRRVQQRQGTANGIAWDSAGGRVLVTGKLWPHLYSVSWPRN